MNTTHWVAIAAMISAAATSWGQYWLKQRSERKALPTAAPVTTKPKYDEETKPTKRPWDVVAGRWFFNISSNLIISYHLFFPQAITTSRRVVIIALACSVCITGLVNPVRQLDSSGVSKA